MKNRKREIKREWLVDFCFSSYLPSTPFHSSKPHCFSAALPSNTLVVVCFPSVFPLHTNSLSPSLKSRLYNLRHSLPSLALLRKASRQMLRFNALIWPAVSSSVSLILIHLVSSKTLWSNLGKLALSQNKQAFVRQHRFFLSLFSLARRARTQKGKARRLSLGSTNGIVHTPTPDMYAK